MKRLIAAATTVTALPLALGVVFARRVVGSYGHGSQQVVSSSADSITFHANRKTSHPGTFGFWFTEGHALVGEVIATDEDRKTVERRLITLEGQLSDNTKGIWEGDVFRNPSVIGHYRDIDIIGPTGVSPAWQFDGEDKGFWAIHVHGIRTTKMNAVRTVPPFQSSGATSLVVSYRGDGEGPSTGQSGAMLGLTEWEDVEAAIDYAINNGARRIVLVGWSMGASVVLLAAERSAHNGLIAGILLVSPAVEWRTIMSYRAQKMGIPLPRLCSRLAELVLSTPGLCRLAGLAAPIDFTMLDWTHPGRVTVPVFAVHSDGDQTIPLQLSRTFADNNPDLVDLHITADADHSWEYNVGPENFNQAIQAWAEMIAR
ncbi:alpha/beta hydrolase [Subtercola vilae]|uniref:Alpha/beta hydrolase n=1 Tax=Subtercola vilae TaxID=2056433 RepID=A0A4T2BRG0_9MICO|nr:alpha/beta hydrolase [Subtercola vilae]TIH33800.1 alpha/beta hydrolase [Subtercola vilae]